MLVLEQPDEDKFGYTVSLTTMALWALCDPLAVCCSAHEDTQRLASIILPGFCYVVLASVTSFLVAFFSLVPSKSTDHTCAVSGASAMTVRSRKDHLLCLMLGVGIIVELWAELVFATGKYIGQLTTGANTYVKEFQECLVDLSVHPSM